MEVAMKRILLIFLVTVFLVLGFPTAAGASPAYDGLKTYMQPDKTKIEFRLMGDEHFNWRETPEGDIIMLDKNSKYYCYAQFKSNKISKTDARVGVDKKPFVRLTRKSLLSLTDYSIRNGISLGGLTSFTSSVSFSTSGDTVYAPAAPAPKQKILVVLVEFANVSISQNDSYWNRSFFSSTSKSISDYYKEISRSKLTFLPVAETSDDANHEGAIDDGVIRIQLGYDHPAASGFLNTELMQQAITSAAIDAIKTAAPFITDLSSYDVNENGVLENSELHIVTIFAGFEMSSNPSSYNNAIWAHAMNFGEYGYGDLGSGLSMEGYMAVGEKMDATNPITIGVFCHELGHSLGLPDLYDYGRDSMGLGPHSLMSLGSWGAEDGQLSGSSPVHLDAWSKIQLGFAATTKILSTGAYTVNAQTSPDYSVLVIAGGLPGQYFLVERRSLTGYDAGLANFGINSGVAIYHIDENVMSYGIQNWNGLINENEFRKAVDLEEANMGILGYSEMDTNPISWDGRHYFTSSLGLNSFGASSNPSSGLYDKTIISPFASVAANGTQSYASGINLAVSSAGSNFSDLSITVPLPTLHANAISNQTYTGLAIKPVMQVHDGSEYLELGVDFTLVYRNNVLPGKASFDIIGIGAYEGLTGTGTFIIVPKSLTSATLQLNEKYADIASRYRTIKASWSAVTGASGYYVAYRASTSTVWSSAFVTGTSWTKTLSAGTLYYLKVRPYVVTDGTIKNYSALYSPQYYVYTLKAPTLSLAKYGTRSVKVSLGSVLGESGYDVRRASSLYGTYYHKAYVKANSTYWIDSTTYVGKSYYYKIRAYKVVNGVIIYGPYSYVKYIRR
jgi:M6 family metalloprotease-like protein